MGYQTKKQIAGAQRRSLRKMREKLLSMAAVWEEQDQFNMNQLVELADRLETVAFAEAVQIVDGTMAVLMVADLWGKSTRQVAVDVAKARGFKMPRGFTRQTP